MPITPYHFGPSGLAGLIFRRWIDPVIFVAANVVVDVEVLAAYFGISDATPHRVWHVHTLLVGGAVGGIFGLACWDIRPIRRMIEWFTRAARIPYTATPGRMILGGAMGIGLHVLIDSVYHYDVQALWPYRDNILYRWISFGIQPQVQRIVRQACAACWVVAVIVWVWIAMRKNRMVKPSA